MPELKRFCRRDRRRYKTSKLPCNRKEKCPYKSVEKCNYIASQKRMKPILEKYKKKQEAIA